MSADMNAWLPMHMAPRTGPSIILCLGDTIPDVPYVRTGCFHDGDGAEDLGYREYAKYGGWLIFDENCESFYMVDFDEPRGWMPLPDVVFDNTTIEATALPDSSPGEMARIQRRLRHRAASALEARSDDIATGEAGDAHTTTGHLKGNEG